MRNIISGAKKAFDYGNVASNYNKYRKPFPDKFFSVLKDKKLIGPGKNILDLGAGTGTISRRLAQIEPNCRITALDCSQGMLDEASTQDENLGIRNITYQCAPAENSKLPDNFFDLIIAGRCWHWFKQDEVIEEIKRISKPNATFVIANYDPVLEDDNVLDITRKLIYKYDPTWQLPIEKELKREYRYVDQLMKKDFSDVQLHIFIKEHLVSQEEWVNFFNTTSAVGGNSKLSEEEKRSLNEEHAQLLKRKYGDNELKLKYTLSTMFFKVPDKKPTVIDEPENSSSSGILPFKQ